MNHRAAPKPIFRGAGRGSGLLSPALRAPKGRNQSAVSR